MLPVREDMRSRSACGEQAEKIQVASDFLTGKALTSCRAQLPAIVSVHDVMPETLAQVENILSDPLSAFDPAHVLLLVVPGRPWQPAQLQRLRQLRAAGYEFAGHGWSHEVMAIRTLYHWWHSLLLSRRAAEHLSQDVATLQDLLLRNAQWFCEQGFGQPALYVPPAWALGELRWSHLRVSPFKAVETLRGIGNIEGGSFKHLPLAGFEADTGWRAWLLGCLNRLAFTRAKPERPVRIAIHPYDFDFYLSQTLREVLQRVETVHWSSVFKPEAPRR